MTNSQNKFSSAILALLFVSTLLFISCKETNKDPETVTFDLSIAESDTITIDPVIDSSSAAGNFYKVSLSINNNFFRLACEENSVYLDDVESVTLKSASVEYIAPSGGSLASFKNIAEYANDATFGLNLVASSETITGNPVTLSLTPSTNNLKSYFRLIYTPIDIYIQQQDLNFSTADLKFKFYFTVKGKNH